MLREKWNYNYSVNLKDVSEWYRNPLKGAYSDIELEQVLPRTPEPIFVIAHPALERNSILLHAALGHELGHLVVEKWLKGDEGKKSLGKELRERAKNLVDAELAASATKRKPIEITARIGTVAQDLAWRRKRLFQEYGADFLGIHLFGPAALFALAHIAMSRNRNEPLSRLERDYYPPWWKRVALAVTALKEDSGNGNAWLPLSIGPALPEALLGLEESLNGRLAGIDQLAQPLPVAPSPVDAAAFEMAETALSDFKSAVRKQFAGSPDPTSTTRDALTLVLRLKDGLPPNDLARDSLETHLPPIESVLNAAWFYRVWLIDNHACIDERVSRLAVLNRLVIKALEDITTVSDYRIWKEEAQP